MSHELIKAILIILLFFIAGAFSILFLSGVNSDKSTRLKFWKDFWQEILTVTAVLIPVYLGNILFIVFLLSFNLRAQFEIFNLYNFNNINLFRVTGFILSSGIIILVFYFHQLLIMPVILLALFFLISIFTNYNKSELLNSTKYSLIITAAISSLVIIHRLDNGVLLIVFIYLVSETNDAFAMLFGSKLGKKNIFINISPNKTLEGLLTGIGFAIAAGLIFNFFFNLFSLLLSIAIIFLIITGAISGDLLFSSCKRLHNVKDFTPIYKELNGVIDIYDSFLISALFFYCYIMIDQFLFSTIIP